MAWARPRREIVHLLIEEVHGTAERFTQLPKAARGEAVCSSLILLNLLKADPHGNPQLFLTDSQQQAPFAQPATDVSVYGIRLTRRQTTAYRSTTTAIVGL